MTIDQLNTVLDTTYTIPVVIRNITFPNNTPYQELHNLDHTGFSFTVRELLHVIGSKTASLPSSEQDECVNSAFLYAHLLDFQGQYLGYKPSVIMDSDLQTNRSNEIGIGIGCLIANKIFNVSWDTLESIKGQGKRFDYRATNPTQRQVYEFKGTKHRAKQSEQITNGLLKKGEMHNRNESYDVELIISTHLGFSNQEPRIVVADPHFEGFKGNFTEEAELLYRLRHLSRIGQFMGDTPLSRNYYLSSMQFLPKKELGWIQNVAFKNISLEYKVIDTQIKIETLYVQGEPFIGRWVSYWQPEKKRLKRKGFELPSFSGNEDLEIFQGVTRQLYEFMKTYRLSDFENKLQFEKKKVKTESGIEFTTFDDGTVMAFRFR
jgi:hypothetical protein